MNNTMYAIKDVDTKDFCFFTKFDLETEAWIRRHYIELDSTLMLYEVDDLDNMELANADIRHDFDEFLSALYSMYVNFEN